MKLGLDIDILNTKYKMYNDRWLATPKQHFKINS